MLLLLIIWVTVGPPVLGKSCSFGLLCVSFVGVCQILCVFLSFFGIEGRMWDVIVLIPDHCPSIYFDTRGDQEIRGKVL